MILLKQCVFMNAIECPVRPRVSQLPSTDRFSRPGTASPSFKYLQQTFENIINQVSLSFYTCFTSDLHQITTQISIKPTTISPQVHTFLRSCQASEYSLTHLDPSLDSAN